MYNPHYPQALPPQPPRFPNVEPCVHPLPADKVETAIQAGLREQLRIQLTCSICNGWKANSLVLCCGHTFCGGCLYHTLASHAQVKPKCPTCQIQLRAPPVKCIALDGIVHAMQNSFTPPEYRSYVMRIEEGKGTADKLTKAFNWVDVARGMVPPEPAKVVAPAPVEYPRAPPPPAKKPLGLAAQNVVQNAHFQPPHMKHAIVNGPPIKTPIEQPLAPRGPEPLVPTTARNNENKPPDNRVLYCPSEQLQQILRNFHK